MSDTLQEEEDQKAVEWHNFVPQDDYNVRLCAVCGFGKNDHYRYYPQRDQNAWLECCQGYSHAPWCSAYVSADRCPQCGGLNTSRGKTRLWCNDCQQHTWTYGTYESAKEVTEHEPAARGGGDEWRVEYTKGRGYRVNDSRGCLAEVRDEATAIKIITAHNQHQSLVTERERLIVAAKAIVERLKDLPRYLEKNHDQTLASITAECLADLAVAIPANQKDGPQ